MTFICSVSRVCSRRVDCEQALALVQVTEFQGRRAERRMSTSTWREFQQPNLKLNPELHPHLVRALSALIPSPTLSTLGHTRSYYCAATRYITM